MRPSPRYGVEPFVTLRSSRRGASVFRAAAPAACATSSAATRSASGRRIAATPPAAGANTPLTEPLRSNQPPATRHGNTLKHMRRLVVICASLVALAAPASALALHASTGDGTLVVRNGVAPHGVPVVALHISGAVIGHVGHGQIRIDDPTPNNKESPEVTGWESRRDGPT